MTSTKSDLKFFFTSCSNVYLVDFIICNKHIYYCRTY